MSNKGQQNAITPRAVRQHGVFAPLKLEFPSLRGASCDIDAEQHCITCSDEALPVTVVSVDEQAGVALVAVQDTTEEIDITLVGKVAPGNTLLAHGGVAIALLDEANHE